MSQVRASVTILLTLLLLDSAHADPRAPKARPPEHSVKAAFLYQFCAYVEWPPHAFSGKDAPLVVGVAGSVPVTYAITNSFAGKRIANRPFEVHSVNKNDDLAGVHILYIQNESGVNLLDFLQLAQDRPILTVTEARSFPRGSIINFVNRNDYVRFEISKSRAEAVGLKVGSQLLAVATRVQ